MSLEAAVDNVQASGVHSLVAEFAGRRWTLYDAGAPSQRARGPAAGAPHALTPPRQQLMVLWASRAGVRKMLSSHPDLRFELFEFSARAPTTRGTAPLSSYDLLQRQQAAGAVDSAARHSTPCVPFCMGKKGTKRVLEYARLAMGFAHVRASRYGIP